MFGSMSPNVGCTMPLLHGKHCYLLNHLISVCNFAWIIIITFNVYVYTLMWRSEENFVGIALYLYHVGLGGLNIRLA